MLNKAKKYKLTNEEIARIFSYKSTNAFNSSSAKTRILRAVERLIAHVEICIADDINS